MNFSGEAHCSGVVTPLRNPRHGKPNNYGQNPMMHGSDASASGTLLVVVEIQLLHDRHHPLRSLVPTHHGGGVDRPPPVPNSLFLEQYVPIRFCSFNVQQSPEPPKKKQQHNPILGVAHSRITPPASSTRLCRLCGQSLLELFLF